MKLILRVHRNSASPSGRHASVLLGRVGQYYRGKEQEHQLELHCTLHAARCTLHDVLTIVCCVLVLSTHTTVSTRAQSYAYNSNTSAHRDVGPPQPLVY